jgi:hypothetical protein
MTKEQVQMLYDLVKEVREEQKEQRNDISDIKKTNYENHLNWLEHTRRTAALEKIVDTQGIRIETLEEPEKVKEAVRTRAIKWAGAIAAILSVAAAAAKFFG